MVACHWQGRLAFLCVASWLCACRVLRGVAVVFLFLVAVLRGVLVWNPRCLGSSRDDQLIPRRATRGTLYRELPGNSRLKWLCV